MSKKQSSTCNYFYDEDFPFCCGIGVIGSFQVDDDDDFNVDCHLNINNIREEGRNLILATTTPNQKEAIKALKKLGFKRMARFKSYSSGNVITLWGKGFAQGRSKGYTPRVASIG
jgi:hypothetical protein